MDTTINDVLIEVDKLKQKLVKAYQLESVGDEKEAYSLLDESLRILYAIHPKIAKVMSEKLFVK